MTDTVPVTVSIPVGPLPHNRRWLAECLDSVLAQSPAPSEVVVIDDGGHGTLPMLPAPVRVVRIPWPSGVAQAHNCAVGAAFNNCVIVLNSDDKLLPGAVGAAWAAYQRERDDAGYYWFEVLYSSGEVQRTADGCGMATQGLWRRTGGFPREGAVGGADWMFLSLLTTGGLGAHVHAIGGGPLYWYREHPETDTAHNRRAQRGPLTQAVLAQLTREQREQGGKR